MRALLASLLCLVTLPAVAQQAPTSSDSAKPTPSPAVAMDEPRPGDHWTYELHDEISGKTIAKRTDTITEVTPTQIAIIFTNEADKDKKGFLVYDRNWNLKSREAMRFTPHDGLGVVQPLSVGADWNLKVEQVNTEKGFTWKWSGKSKVSTQEQVKTKAGTFDAYKIETNYSFYPVRNPSLKSETVMVTWYVPSVDHWVRRTVTTRSDNLLRVNHTIELVDYGRKE
ncbi:hypothetical protein [Bradyrhizobium sp. USDA 4353]